MGRRAGITATAPTSPTSAQRAALAPLLGRIALCGAGSRAGDRVLRDDVTLLSVGLGLAIIYVGVPILAVGLLVARLGGLVQRSLALALLDLRVCRRPGRVPRRPGPISALGSVLRDPAGWRAVAYFVIKIVLAPADLRDCGRPVRLREGALTYPVWRQYLP